MTRSHRILLGGIAFVPDATGALYAPDLHTLLVADLHLEQGTAMARRGVHVPPFDTPATLAQLASVIARTKPWRLMLLGDSFHDAVAHELIDAQSCNALRSITSAVETIWISGNHDPQPPVGLGGVCVQDHRLGDIALRHEPSRPLSDAFEIAGHLHPGAVITQRGIGTRAKCFIADTKRIILPAFGSYTGALNVRSKAFAHLFDEDATRVWMLGRRGIHAFPLSRVG